jgi:hypothetical protein
MSQPRKLDLVVIPRARLQEVIDEAVARGRITRAAAADLVADLLARARDIEQLVTRLPVEAARRAPGSELPISGYDDLTAAQVAGALDGMGVADLRRVREYEKANANRKTVLAAIERKLG